MRQPEFIIRAGERGVGTMSHTLAETFLMVSDLDDSVEFYAEALGLDIIERGNDVTFDTGTAKLIIEEDFEEGVLADFGLEPPGEDRGDGAIIVIQVDDVDAVHERADEYGAEIVFGPADVDWGRRMFLVRDPDGYVLEVSTPIEDEG